jgi:hypothetical protein
MIRENKKAYSEALAKVTSHPMCLRVRHEGGKTIIVYPAGDFPVDGVRVDKCTRGFEQALAVMERHWLGSFPAANCVEG